jgi:hypothetical protein
MKIAGLYSYVMAGSISVKVFLYLSRLSSEEQIFADSNANENWF